MKQHDQIDQLLIENQNLADLCGKLPQQAEGHAQEARTQRSTVHDIYQLIGAQKGDWNGAEPVREYIRQQAARIAELERKLNTSIERENGSDIAADMAMNSVNELQTRTIQQADRIAELEGQIKSRVVCDGYPTFYISAEGRACTHRMSEEDTPVWCRSGNDGMAAMSAIQPPADALAMSESKADDYLRLAQKLRAGLQEIYTMRGEDEFIAGICNPLIEVSAP